MKSSTRHKKVLLNFILSTKAITGKLLMILSPLLLYIQSTVGIEFWEKIANISIAVFVLLIGIFILYKEYKRQDKYSKQLHERIIIMAEQTAKLAENSTRATENSTEAIRNMTQSMERITTRLDNLET